MAAAIASEYRAQPGKWYCLTVHMKVGNRMQHIHAASAALIDALEGFHIWYGKTKHPNHMHSWRGDTAAETAHNVGNSVSWRRR